ncbi:MAG: hypothetical protein WD847_05030 [Pirellulales bacterium]
MTKLPRRLSPVHDELAQLDPFWGTVHDMPVAALLPGGPPFDVAAGPGLCDASALPRMLVRGPAAADFLSQRGVQVPRDTFAYLPLEGDGLVIRTAMHEFFLEDGCRGDAIERLGRAVDAGWPGVGRSLRQDVSLLLSGEQALDVLAQTSSYDFRQGPDFVMTRLAAVSCSVLARPLAAGPTFQLWADASYGPYLWETLLEIVRDLGGGPLGLSLFFSNAAFAAPAKDVAP